MRESGNYRLGALSSLKSRGMTGATHQLCRVHHWRHHHGPRTPTAGTGPRPLVGRFSCLVFSQAEGGRLLSRALSCGWGHRGEAARPARAAAGLVRNRGSGLLCSGERRPLATSPLRSTANSLCLNEILHIQIDDLKEDKCENHRFSSHASSRNGAWGHRPAEGDPVRVGTCPRVRATPSPARQWLPVPDDGSSPSEARTGSAHELRQTQGAPRWWGARGGRCGSPHGADSSLRHTRVRRPSCALCFKTACIPDTVHEASVTIYTFVTDENVDAPGG